jgi:hypothetical protein
VVVVVEVVATGTEPAVKETLVDLRAYSFLIVPVRFVLGIGGLVGARLLGVAPGASLALFAFGGGLFLFAQLTTNRRRRFWQRVAEAQSVDPSTPVEDRLRTLARSTYPSTIGVAVLTAIALPIDAALGAFTAGLMGGMALFGLLFGAELVAWERSEDARLFLAPTATGPSRLFVRRSV